MRWLLPILALLLPLPALADVTARYAAERDVLTVEVADNGASRAGIDGKFVLLRRDGVDYIILPDHDGVLRVARADAALAAFVAHKGPPPQGGKWSATPGMAATVAGYAGTLWRFGPDDDTSMELLMSLDPALAPVGEVFRHVAEAVAVGVMGKSPEDGGLMAALYALAANGTPIRIREFPRLGSSEPQIGKPRIRLESVSGAPIDPHRFDLPGPVLEADAFFAAIMPPPPVRDEDMVPPEHAEPSPDPK
jgi:hypothetical protein